jgi:lipid-A-disaccharide synthase
LKRIFFVAGERSGDSHGAALIRALRAADPSIACEGLGGEQMAAAGMDLRYDLAGEAIMGFAEVIKHLRPIRRLLLDTRDHLCASPPDCVVLIDYPGFNIRLAKSLLGSGIPSVYYISPQVWAWKKKRIHTIAACVRKMLVIFPFEEALYRKIGVDCRYVGNPLLDQVAEMGSADAGSEDLIIGLLPGSREQEIRRLLPTMLAVARGIKARYPNARFQTPCVHEGRAAQIRALASDFPLEVSVGTMYGVLSSARFCLVTSGTATLETALFGTPMVILYRMNEWSYWLARLLVRGIEHIGIVNILAQRGIVPEFIQHDAAPEKIIPVALELIEEGPARSAMLEGFREVHDLLGGEGASERAAQEILDLLKGNGNG